MTMASMTGAEAVVQSLLSYGVDTVFGLPGVQLDPLFDAFYGARDRLRVIHSRHEQGAAYMALGYARSTGRVGAFAVVPGPGVLNAGAALLTAKGQGASVLCLAGQIPSAFIDQGYGCLHEMYDQPGTMAAVTKWQGRPADVGAVPATLRDAFIALMSGRRGPSFFEIAPDILAKSGPVTLLPAQTDVRVAAPDPDAIERAAAILGAAERPAIFVGGGIWGAEPALHALAEQLQAPVVMSDSALGAIDWRQAKAQTLLAGRTLWNQSDAILAVGTRLYTQKFNWSFEPPKTLIRIDVDAAQAALPWSADVTINAEAEPSLALLVDRLARHNRQRASRDAELEAVKADAARRLAGALPQSDAFNAAIRRALPADGFACFDVTQLGFHAWCGFPAYHPRSVIHSGMQGTLGYGFATALGVKVAHPDRAVVCVAGDGGFLFAASELATAAQHGINLVTVIMNDGAYGNVKRNQQLRFNEHYIACELKNPDFTQLAEAYGVWGRRVETPDALEQAIRAALAAEQPALIEVPVAASPSWERLYRGG